ncbi:molybdopterin molybdenumtransferase MoeA [Altererythrobacter soli]|uniref:Molybdopterin molybdenumtransferase n=1 Tax=Croceibacterium soli TaxID=1739690 RepID=A0A6I4V010_9SPHN|nr:molybdopterin molybdotransferase MoeA [Croceibacterium soli]MXP42355.1 molybdopterin molybdenumtransferase MoeA [Croceibacterium soli]
MNPPPPLPLAEAQARLLAQVEPLPARVIPAEQAVSRYLGAPLLAARTQPAADLSAMDGYAVLAEDLAGPWQIIGESAAGHPFAGTLRNGEAVRISTGALMPAGDCAVLLQENAARNGARLALNGEGEPTPRHIRRTGFDFRQGDQILRAGARIGPAQLALAIAAGHSRLPVRALPRLAILDSGDELAADPAGCAPHQIPASNGAMLATMTAPYAGTIERLGPVPDRMEAILAALDRAAEADVIVTSGGASVGDHDLVRPALEQWGAKLDFWRVAMKPGKPLLVARRGGQWVIGLPGNPVSSYVTAFLFLLPLLRALAGSGEPLPRCATMRLGAPFPATGDRMEFVRARLEGGALVPVAEQDSSALAALALADALVERPANSPSALAGDPVPAYWIGHGGTA